MSGVEVEHLAHPDPEQAGRCVVCHQPIHQDSETWVHSDSGAVAAPTP